jgi:beta-glucosidase
LKGLDQESGAPLDVNMWGAEAFVEPLRKAYVEGKFPKERLSDMVRRILRSAYAVGVDKWGPTPAVDLAAHNELALEIAREGIVLLKNEGNALPIATDRPLKIAVIGGYAQLGVASGTGSGAVSPVGGYAGEVPIGGTGIMGGSRNLYLLPPSPLAELKKLLPQAEFEFDSAYTPAESALLARRADVVIVFGIRTEGEGFDIADLSLPWGQDAVIDAVANANPNTIVVLETGNPVSMPWRDKVKAIAQAWYPGQAGGQAIAEVLTGQVNPSGRTPITWPASLADTPRPELPGLGTPWGTPITIRYDEGADVGYRWYAKRDIKPLYAFGHGLSYTSFAYSDLKVTGEAIDGEKVADSGGVGGEGTGDAKMADAHDAHKGGEPIKVSASKIDPASAPAAADEMARGETISASFTVTNTGDKEGADVPQLYLTAGPNEKRMRLLGFQRVVLKPGESKEVTLTVDPRLLARFDGQANQWRITEGTHQIALGRSADELVLTGSANLVDRTFGK